MKIYIALLTVSLALLSACGEDLTGTDAGTGNDAGSSHLLTTGTYAVSGATATTADECGLLSAYTDPNKMIGITASGSTITFNLANDANAPANSLPKAVLAGNTLGQATEANYTIAYPPSGVVRVHRTVVGTLLNDNSASLTLSFNALTETGTTCSAADTSFSALPCASSYTFTATKQ